MGVIHTSKDQALLVTDSTKAQDKGRPKGKEKNFEKKKCPYCMRGFHPEYSCMKKTLDQLKALCVQKNISLPQGSYMSNSRENTKEYVRFLYFKVGLTLSKAYLIDFGTSNHMVSSRESFTTLTLSWGYSTDMGCDF